MKQAFRTVGFNADFDTQYRWYLEKAGEEVADKFFHAILITLRLLAREPGLGRVRKFQHPALSGVRSFPAARPFNRFLIFYRLTDEGITVLRMIDGGRDLPRRLVEKIV